MTNALDNIRRRRNAGHSALIAIASLPFALLAGVYLGQAIQPAVEHVSSVRTYEIVQELSGQAFIVDYDLSAADCALLVERYPGGTCLESH